MPLALFFVLMSLSGTWWVYNNAIDEAKSKTISMKNTRLDSLNLPPAIDGITCTSKPIVLHEHVLLTLYDNGQRVTIPAGIGLYNNTCAYWLHTHDSSGIVHIESPVRQEFTLGEFFDVWGQPLSKSIVGPFVSNNVTFYVNGTRFTGNPRNLVLHNHDCITIEIGKKHIAPVTHYDFLSVESGN